MGGSAVCSLHKKFGSNIHLAVGGRREQNWLDYARLKGLPTDEIGFVPVDIRDAEKLRASIDPFDIIVHTAGPFQGLQEPTVLKASMDLGKQYLDVCDDIALSRTARSVEMQRLAESTGGRAVISTGIWPGCSSLLAKQMVENAGGVGNIEKVDFSFYTAGSGGAGPTILSATFLILGEDVLTYVEGKPVYRKSASDSKLVDFGRDIGMRSVARLNLIECESCFHIGVPNVQTFFGTAPPIWNKLFVLMANLIPQSILKDRQKMDLLGRVSLPMVRAVDLLVGSTNAIRVDIETVDGKKVTGLLSHRDMEKAVGDSIAAFVEQLDVHSQQQQQQRANGDLIPAGVYFPEEVPSEKFRQNILREISEDAILYSTNWKPNII